MKKRNSLLPVVAFVALLSSRPAVAQSNAVGIGTTSPHPSAILDVSSATKGVLIPRLSQSQRDAVGSPAAGLLIYQTDGTAGFYYYNGSAWQVLGAGGSGANRFLSNLENGTAVNTHLVPAGSGLYTLGTAGNGWRDLYLNSDIYIQGSRTLSVFSSNSFFGPSAGHPGITGSQNIGIGASALFNNISGNWNTAIGAESLFNTTGFSNTSLGYQSGYANSVGGYNTAIGTYALLQNATGSGNTAVGESAGSSLLNGSNNTFIGVQANSQAGSSISNATAIGYGTVVSASNSVRVGNGAVTSIGGAVNWSAFSDGRFKENIREDVPGLSFINKLRPVTYQLSPEKIDALLNPGSPDTQTQYSQVRKSQLSNLPDRLARQQQGSITYSGFIAQEVEQTAKSLGYGFSGVDAPKHGNDVYGLRYAEFVVPLVKSVQELHQQLQALKKGEKEKYSAGPSELEKTVRGQQEEIDTLKKLVAELQQQMVELKTGKRD